MTVIPPAPAPASPSAASRGPASAVAAAQPGRLDGDDNPVRRPPGVDRTTEILQGQIESTMRLLGVKSLDELEPGHVSALRRLG